MRPLSCRIGWLMLLIPFIAIVGLLSNGCEKELVEPEDPDAPIINSLTADPPTIGIRGRVTLKCIAADPEHNKDFTFSWSSTAGSFVNSNGDSTTHPDLSVHANYATWNAPDTPQDVTMTVVVDDETNQTSQSVGVRVTAYELVAYWGMVEAAGDSTHHPGMLDMPRGVEIVGDYCYVADWGNDRMQRFSRLDGTYDTLWTFVVSGPDTVDIDGPIDIAADDAGNVFLVDHRRLYRFDAVGQDIVFDRYASVPDSFSIGLATDAGGNVYLSKGNSGTIRGYDGDNLSSLPSLVTGLSSPRGITFDPGDDFLVVDYDRIPFADTIAPDSIVYDTTTVSWILRYEAPAYVVVSDTIGQYGEAGDGELYVPFALAYGAFDDAVFVTDLGGSGDPLLTRVVMFSSDGTFQLEWGSAGGALESFNAPLGLAADDEGFVYVSDTGNNAIKKYSP